MKLILGSRSEGRRKVLQRMGYRFDVMPADIDEKAIRHDDPELLVLALAKAKAAAIMEKVREDAILITSDQVVVCKGVIREKPTTDQEVRTFFADYIKYPAETITAVQATNTATRECVSGVDRAKIWFRPVPTLTLYEYIVVDGDPFDHAGGFDHEHPLLSLYVDRIEGEGESITGLPAKLTRELLSHFGL